MSDTAALLAELNRVKALFQARAIAAAMGLPSDTASLTPSPMPEAETQDEERTRG